MAKDGDGWKQVTDVVAGRPEKKAKETMLAALRAPETVERIGAPAVGEALAVLGAGDDAAFSAKVASAGRCSARRTSTKVRISMSPSPHRWDSGNCHRRPRGWSCPRSPLVITLLLARGAGGVGRPQAARASCPAGRGDPPQMLQGRYDGMALTMAVGELLETQKLSVATLCSALEDLFLAGGLRQAWPTAVSVTEAAAGATTKPAGLADLLRLLARYAIEVPDPEPLPPHLAALAADRSRTKTVMEARRLASALRLDPLPRQSPASPAAVIRGLWEAMTVPDEPLPSHVRITDLDDPLRARGEDLAGLREVLSENFNGCTAAWSGANWEPPGHGGQVKLFELTRPDRVVASTVRAAHRHGSDVTQRALVEIEWTHRLLDVVAAIDVWAAGRLDREVFWRVATGPTMATSELYGRYRELYDDHRDSARARIDALDLRGPPSFPGRRGVRGTQSPRRAGQSSGAIRVPGCDRVAAARSTTTRWCSRAHLGGTHPRTGRPPGSSSRGGANSGTVGPLRPPARTASVA